MHALLRRLSLRPLKTTAKYLSLGLLSLYASQTTHAQTTIPATIEAESMAYSNGGVFTEATYDTGGGLNVGWIDTNDWMVYRINVPAAGTYKLTFRVASAVNGAQIWLNQNNADISPVVPVPNTGGWQKWQDLITTAKFTSAGVQEIAIYAKAGGFNINWFSLAADTSVGMRSLRVWPVGDSITDGASNNWQNWSPENGGYRRNLMLLLNNGYSYSFSGPNNWPADVLGDLPAFHSGYRGAGLSVLTSWEFEPTTIRNENPDAVLLMLGINSIGSKKEYPDSAGSYWNSSNKRFNKFFIEYKAFIDKVLNNSNATVFIAKLPNIGDTRFYLQPGYWDDTQAPNQSKWNTVGDGTINPKNVVGPFNNELQALYNTYYAGNPRVVVVDLNSGLSVGPNWEDDVTMLGVPQQWWNGDGLHPTQVGYRHIAERWNTAIRKAFPTAGSLLYSVDCGAKENVVGLESEGAIRGSAQSVVWDKAYGPDAITGKKWGHIGEASYAGSAAYNPTMYFAWEGANTVYDSVATAAPGNSLVYRFEVPAGGTYRVQLGFHDSWGEAYKWTNRTANIFIDGANKGEYKYHLKDFGRKIYQVVNTSGTLEVKVTGTNGTDALLDSITIQRVN